MTCKYHSTFLWETPPPTAQLKPWTVYGGSTPPLLGPAFKPKEAHVSKNQAAQAGGVKWISKLISLPWRPHLSGLF